MKNSLNLSVAALTALVFSASASSAHAQSQVGLQDMQIVMEMQKTPEYQASVSSSKKDGDRSEWLELEVAFKTDSDSKIDYTSEVTFNYYIALEAVDPETGRPVPTLLTAQVTYVNIPDGEDNFAAVYVSPSTLSQLAGGPGDFKPTMVLKYGVEALFRGQSLGAVDKDGIIRPGTPPWWTAASLSRREGTILRKEKTPFSLLWLDRHVEARPQE